jgi:hypothetical protein
MNIQKKSLYGWLNVLVNFTPYVAEFNSWRSMLFNPWSGLRDGSSVADPRDSPVATNIKVLRTYECPG